MTNYTIAVIRCIRDSHGSNDDKIIIMGNTDNTTMFRVKHRVPSPASGTDRPYKITHLMNNEALHLYLHALFTLLRNDEAPFEHIQFDITGIPTTIVKPYNLDYVTCAVMNYINTITGLGTEYSPPVYKYVGKKSKGSHLFFDSDGEEC
jgi:hypothetical protein